MKKILIIITLISVCLGFSSAVKREALAQGQNPELFIPVIANRFRVSQIKPNPAVQEMINQASQARILTDLRRLSGAEQMCTTNGCRTLSGRFTGSDDLSWAMDYVYETLTGLNYSVERINWSDTSNDTILAGQDILAHKTGLLYPNEEIYFIAHVDGYPPGGPAADDDGTGAAALLELARILANTQISRSVTLFFSTGEEQGAVGAYYFVNHYHDRLSKIKYLVSVEMLGHDSNGDGKMELWSVDDNTEFQFLLSDMITAYPASINLVPEVATGCT